MYSKLGKKTEDMFLILREKEEIISKNSKRICIKSSALSFAKPRLNLEEIKKLIRNNRERAVPSVIETSGTSSFLSPPRGNRNELKGISSLGHYDSNYKQVWKHIPGPFISSKQEKPSKGPYKKKKHKIVSKVLPKPHITSPVHFSKQISRFSNKNIEEIPEVEPNYIYFNKPCKTPNFAKITGRRSSVFGFNSSENTEELTRNRRNSDAILYDGSSAHEYSNVLKLKYRRKNSVTSPKNNKIRREMMEKYKPIPSNAETLTEKLYILNFKPEDI